MAGRPRRALVGALVVVVLGSAGCGGGGGAADAAAPSTTVADVTTTEATTTTTAPPTEEQAVLAAYQGYWDTWLEANDPPDPDHPDLAKYATGKALAQARRTVAAHKQQGHALRLPVQAGYKHRPKMVELASGRALVEDCSLDDGLVVDRATGVVLDDSVWTRKTHVELLWIEEAWKVQLVTLDDKWQGDTSCVG